MRLLTRRPGLLALGALPPLITSLLLGALFVLLAFNVMDVADALTGFADSWSASLAEALRYVVAGAVLVAAAALMVLAFSTITLALGSPVYDRIGEQTEELAGAAPAVHEEPLRVSLPRTVRQSVALVLLSVLLALPVFLVGLVPVVGTVLGAVASACVGGWLITTEMVGGALERRGRVRLSDRWALMRRNRARCLGFGIPVFLLLSMPLVAIAVFPVASAAGTLLARELAEEAGRPALSGAGGR
nr:EI24 domain-containing protein [Auraticoccus cholistanensis]